MTVYLITQTASPASTEMMRTLCRSEAEEALAWYKKILGSMVQPTLWEIRLDLATGEWRAAA